MCGTCREVIGVGRELFIGESRGGKLDRSGFEPDFQITVVASLEGSRC